MSADKKPRADAKLKGLPEADQETFWRMLHPEDAEVKPSTLEDLRDFILRRYDFETLALSTLSEWRSWYALRQRTLNAQARAEQAKLEWIRENPEATPEELERLGQMVFTAEAIEQGSIKGFVMLMRERSRRQALDIDRRKLELLEAAAAEAKAKLEAATAKAKSKGGISEETLAEIEAAANLL